MIHESINYKDAIYLLNRGYIIKISDPKKHFESSVFFYGFGNYDLYTYNDSVGFSARPDMTPDKIEKHFANMEHEKMVFTAKSLSHTLLF